MPRFAIPLILLLAVGAFAGQQDAATGALQQGIELLKAQQYDAAIAKFQEAISARGGNFAEAHFQTGLAYFQSDRNAEAAKEFDKAAEQNPEEPKFQRYIAEVALFEPDFQKALDAYERYLDAMSPRDDQRADALKRVSKLRMFALGTYEAGVEDRKVQFLSNPKPVYPQSVKDNIVGDVIVEAVFTADGDIFDVRVIKSLRKEFDDAAMDMISHLRFKTAIKGGKPASQKQKLKLHYQKVFG
jgi:TonB family protein